MNIKNKPFRPTISFCAREQGSNQRKIYKTSLCTHKVYPEECRDLSMLCYVPVGTLISVKYCTWGFTTFIGPFSALFQE